MLCLSPSLYSPIYNYFITQLIHLFLTNIYIAMHVSKSELFNQSRYLTYTPDKSFALRKECGFFVDESIRFQIQSFHYFLCLLKLTDKKKRIQACIFICDNPAHLINENSTDSGNFVLPACRVAWEIFHLFQGKKREV